MSAVTLTKCCRDGCDRMTPNTFCSRECNRLAHRGPGTRSERRHATTGIRGGVAVAEDALPTPSCHDWRTLREYFKNDAPKDSSNARRVLNAIKRRQEREAMARKRRERRLKKQKG